jgi:hypothetical protein
MRTEISVGAALAAALDAARINVTCDKPVATCRAKSIIAVYWEKVLYSIAYEDH